METRKQLTARFALIPAALPASAEMRDDTVAEYQCLTRGANRIHNH